MLSHIMQVLLYSPNRFVYIKTTTGGLNLHLTVTPKFDDAQDVTMVEIHAMISDNIITALYVFKACINQSRTEQC